MHMLKTSAVLLIMLCLVLSACTAQPQTTSRSIETPDAGETEATLQPAIADEPADEHTDSQDADSNEPSDDSNTPVYTDPPAVPHADNARQYSGTTINYYSGQIGVGSELDNLLIEQFTSETGIIVQFVPKSDDTTEDHAVYEALFDAQSPDIDVLALDIIWPASFAEHLVDLQPNLGDDATEHFTGIIENNTIDGRLIAMPQFGDFGMLYYRTDLLTKYGFADPPATWDDLELMAQTIQEGERAAGNANFVGFVFQGAAYEGGTCNALEWIASHGGSIIEGTTITIASDAAQQALQRAQGWVGSIAPDTVVSFREEDAREMFQGGDAAFMRNWPYAYAMGNADDSPIRGKFDVAPLPHTSDHDSVGTVGGWQLAVSAYSPNPEAAIEFVRYLTSPAVQKWRAIEGSYVPTIRSVSEDSDVIVALPFLKRLQPVVRTVRPSRETGALYNKASELVFQGVNNILRGADTVETLTQVSADMDAIIAQPE